MNAMPQLDTLIEAIRQEATRPEYQLTGTHPLLASPGASSLPPTLASPPNFMAQELREAASVPATHVDELLLVSDNAQFIGAAYQTLLRRPPDAYGHQTYAEKLTQGFGQPFVLAALRASGEGKTVNAPLAGFGLAPLVYNVWRVGRRLGLGTPARWLCNAYSGWRHLRLAATGRLAAQMHLLALRQEPLARTQSEFTHQMAEIGARVSQVSTDVSQRTDHLTQQLSQVSTDVSQRTDHLAQQISQLVELVSVANESIDALSHQTTELLTRTDDLAASEHRNTHLLDELSSRTVSIAQEIAAQQQRLDHGLSLVEEHHRAQLAAEARANFDLQILRARVLALQQRIPAAGSTEVAAPLSEKSTRAMPDSAAVGASQAELDEYYLAFENAHRGSLAEITKKVTPYLAHVAQLPGEILGLPMVDLGCGRGEWMELLREQGFAPQGIDVSPAMVQHCRARGLKVELCGAVQWLTQQPESSCALISGFHIIEHIPFAERLALVKQALRVLAPGGALILETPNPESVLVGSHTFFHDYTHTQPITPTSLQFLLGYQGFVSLKVLRLNPYPASDRVNDQSLLGERVNGHLYGPQDFSVIGYKP